MCAKRLIGIEEVMRFIEQDSSGLEPSRLKWNAKELYVTLFRAACNGQLNLKFVCRKCKLGTETCRCSGGMIQGKWIHHTKPQELSEQWMLSAASVRNLGPVRISRFGRQTIERVERFVKYVKAGCK
jgi:hypothetical protein